MATFDVRTDSGEVYRVEAGSPKEAMQIYTDPQSDPSLITLLPPVVPRPGPGENPVLAPPRSAPPTGGEVYIPPEKRVQPRRQERPLLAPVFDVIEENVVPPLARAAGRGILPTMGSIGMTALPTVYPPAGAIPVQARQSIGSVLGTGANMALGIEEPSLEQLALSAVTPGAAVPTARFAAGRLPGSASARAAGIMQEAEALPGVVRQGVQQADVNALFAGARQANPSIVMPETRTAVQALLAAERQQPGGLQFANIGAISQGLDRLITQAQAQGGVPLAQLDAIRQRVGALINVAENTEEQRALKAIYRSIMTDLEGAAQQLGSQPAQDLLQGITQQRRLFAADDLGQLVANAAGQERSDGLRQLNVGSIIKQLETPRTQQQTMLADFLEQHPQEREAVMATLRDMNQRNVKMLPPTGAMYGAGVGVGRLGRGYMVGTAINTMTGSDMVNPQMMAAADAVVSQGIARMLMTETGRTILRQLYEPTGTLNPMQILAQYGGEVARASTGKTPLSSSAGFLNATIGLPGLGQQQEGTQR